MVARETIELKPRKSFRKNGQQILMQLFASFLSRQEQVVGHEESKEKLHEMRLCGKRLRYVMEIYQPVFGRAFADLLSRLIAVLDIMGDIHECDVSEAVLIDFLEEIRLYNQQVAKQSFKCSLASIQEIIRQQRLRRKKLFIKLSTELDKWKEKRMKTIFSEALN